MWLKYVCGGECRVTKVLIRRLHRHGFRPGKNCDPVCGYDLMNATDVAALCVYLEATRPLVVVMSPPCRGMAGFQSLNRVISYQAWRVFRVISEAIGDLCAEVALFQMACQNHFLNEHPQGSELYQRRLWLRVSADQRCGRARGRLEKTADWQPGHEADALQGQ